MTAYLLADHLLSFIAPAVFVAALLVLVTRIFAVLSRSKRPAALGLCGQVAIIFIANMLVLTAGLVVFGSDGKMLTYAALVVLAAVCQWALGRGWKS